jgi:hypothetical protein
VSEQLERPEQKWLGKITVAEFGYGGYDDAMIGLTFCFVGEYGTTDFFGTWAMPPSKSAAWSVADQRNHFADAVEKLNEILRLAKKKHVGQLVGVPVEVTSQGGLLKSWRVLTEVL